MDEKPMSEYEYDLATSGMPDKGGYIESYREYLEDFYNSKLKEKIMYGDIQSFPHNVWSEQREEYDDDVEEKLYADYEIDTEDICLGRLVPGLLVGRLDEPYSTFICPAKHQHRIKEKV